MLLRTLCCLSAFSLLAQDPGLETLREEGHWKQLRPRIEGWYRSKPEDPYAMLWMSRVKRAFGDPAAGLEIARKAAALKPTDASIQAELGMAAAETAGRTEGMMKQMSLGREMKKALDVAIVGQPGDLMTNQYLFQFFLKAPAIAGGGTDKAKDLALKLTQLKPVDGLLLQASLAFQAKNPEGAKALVQQALAKDPKSYDAHLTMATYHLRQKPQALDAAVGCYRQALLANPKGIVAHAQTAAILAEQGKWAELESCLAQARKATPENLYPYYAAAQNLIAENKSLERVELLLRTYLSQDPEGFMPDRAAAHHQLGLLYDKQNRRAEAIQAFTQALALRPSHKGARKELDRLQKG